MISIDPTLNEFEVLIVTDKLKAAGIEHYELRRGNRCIWATYGSISEYYIFQDGYLVDVQID
jgi:hypothetical protein